MMTSKTMENGWVLLKWCFAGKWGGNYNEGPVEVSDPRVYKERVVIIARRDRHILFEVERVRRVFANP